MKAMASAVLFGFVGCLLQGVLVHWEDRRREGRRLCFLYSGHLCLKR